jgi:hypothetical protein
METSNKRTWRRHLHFRLRTLLALILVFGSGLGWLARLVRSTQIQRNVVTAISQAGGYVMYDWEWKNLLPIPNGKPVWPRWLVDRVGADYFGNVSFVHFDHNPKATDVELAHLRELTGLEQLYLCDTGVRDPGLGYLSGLTRLQFLNLRRTQLGDEGLGHLKGLTSLRVLLLRGTRVTDAGLLHLKGLESLEVLDFALTDIGDAGLEHLKRLTKLKQLDLTRTRVTDAGVDEFQKAMPKLKIYR